MKPTFLFFILHPLRICIFFLSYFFPRDKSKWIFSCWMGQRFSDNVKTFFIYVNRNAPGVRAIWITRSKPLVDYLRGSGFEAYYFLSFRGIYHQISSGVAIVSQLFEWDFEPSFSSNNQIKVQLWHGIPMKKICRDDDRFNHSKSKYIAKKLFFPYLCHSYNLIPASAEYDCNIYPSAFGVHSSAVKITGLPRYDMLDISSFGRKGVFRFCYAPTFRGDIGSVFTLFGDDLTILQNLERFCAINNFEFHIKLHPVQVLNELHIGFIENSKNLFLSSLNTDLTSLLVRSDCLITDFSSAYFDAIYMRKPVLMVPFDFEHYTTNDRALYMDYSSYCLLDPSMDWSGLFGSMIQVSSASNAIAEKINEKRDLFFAYDDGESSARIYSCIVDLIDVN